MDENKTIIFCQAPADISYVLDLYQVNKLKSEISIFVVNVEGLYTFLSSLNLDIKTLVYIPYELKKIKNIRHLFRERNRINKLWQTHFEYLENCNVYFFSRFEDWLTSAFIHRFSKKKKVHISYIDHYDDSSLLFRKRTNFNIKILIYQFILKFLTDITFKVQIGEKLPEFPVSNYVITKTKAKLNISLYDQYKYQINDLDHKYPRLLFFVSSCENTIFDPLFYDERLIEIIELLNNAGFEITIKGHPRIGTPDFIIKRVHSVIPSYIPGEFIDPYQFDLCLGIYTTAICRYASYTLLPTFSLINLFKESSPNGFNIARNYLLQQTNSKIHFCESKSELENIIKSIRITFNERYKSFNNNNHSSL